MKSGASGPMTLGKLARFVLVAVAALVLAAVFSVVAGARHALAPRDLPSATPLSLAGASVDHGRHIAASFGACLECHGADFGGGKPFFRGPMGTLVASNLTRGQGGVGSAYTDTDFERAIRGGVRPDGSGLLIMPSAAFASMSDQDVRDVVAFIRSVPPVDRETPHRVVGPIAAILLATGKILAEPDRIDEAATHLATTPAGPTAKHGEYIARVGGCAECHGANFAGGHYEGSPKDPPASNITPAAIGTWSQADFNRAMREGRDPKGHALNAFMPWTSYGQLSDDELSALWTYLRTIPPIKR